MTSNKSLLLSPSRTTQKGGIEKFRADDFLNQTEDSIESLEGEVKSPRKVLEVPRLSMKGFSQKTNRVIDLSKDEDLPVF